MARRIITGKTADGTSVFVSDEQAPELTLALIPGTVVTSIWSSETIPVSGTDGAHPDRPTDCRPAGDIRNRR